MDGKKQRRHSRFKENGGVGDSGDRKPDRISS
jgi:hypothetical protein